MSRAERHSSRPILRDTSYTYRSFCSLIQKGVGIAGGTPLFTLLPLSISSSVKNYINSKRDSHFKQRVHKIV